MPFTYVSKPVEVSAFQLTLLNRYKQAKWPKWAQREWGDVIRPKFCGSTFLALSSEGEPDATVNIGDFIVKQPDGQIVAYGPDQFRSKFERKRSCQSNKSPASRRK